MATLCPTRSVNYKDIALVMVLERERERERIRLNCLCTSPLHSTKTALVMVLEGDSERERERANCAPTTLANFKDGPLMMVQERWKRYNKWMIRALPHLISTFVFAAWKHLYITFEKKNSTFIVLFFISQELLGFFFTNHDVIFFYSKSTNLIMYFNSLIIGSPWLSSNVHRIGIHPKYRFCCICSIQLTQKNAKFKSGSYITINLNFLLLIFNSRQPKN